MERKFIAFFLFTCFIIGTCMGLMIWYSGFEHESQNAKNIILAIVIVLVFLHLVWDPIRFLILSIDSAFWPRKKAKYRLDQDLPDDDSYNRINFLKQRVTGLKMQMLITERYRNWELNIQYKSISRDVQLYGRYFIILSCVVLMSRNDLSYYNTSTLQKLLMYNQTHHIGLHEVYHLSQLFDFIASSLVDAFNYQDSQTWVHGSQSTLLGVVRLRQLLKARQQFGFSDPVYVNEPFMPDWQLPYQKLFYSSKYWRVYEPWVPLVQNDWVSYVVLNFDHIGRFHLYPELLGYVALLARSKENSMKILDFLTENHWLNYNTSAVFMDFTLYNLDADIFSVCTLTVEQSPFGGILPNVQCDSIQLIGNILATKYTSLLIMMLYLIILLQFMQSFITYVWYDPQTFRSIWYQLDLVIILLNVVVISAVSFRASLVMKMLSRLEGTNKLEFLDFRVPARLYSLTNILTGFLVCCTTLRLWKVMQFAKVFQLFTRTLSLAFHALAITAGIILTILSAYGIAITIINGNHSIHFTKVINSMTAIMCFSFGFIGKLQPSHLFYGGELIGMVIYISMGFVISVLLLNVFSSLINYYFTIARNMDAEKFNIRITFLQYLRVELDPLVRLLSTIFCLRKSYHSNGRTVAQNIELTLNKREKKNRSFEPDRKDEELLELEYRERIQRTMDTSKVLQTQLELLDRLLFDEVDTWSKQSRSARNRLRLRN